MAIPFQDRAYSPARQPRKTLLRIKDGAKPLRQFSHTCRQVPMTSPDIELERRIASRLLDVLIRAGLIWRWSYSATGSSRPS
jgi:hypothetical protein